MAEFRNIEPGWYFVRKERDSVYVGEKLDGSSLPKELQGGLGDEHNIAIPKSTRKEEFSGSARHYGHFNVRVIAATEDVGYRFDYLHSDNVVDAFAPRALDSVVSQLEFQRITLRKI